MLAPPMIRMDDAEGGDIACITEVNVAAFPWALDPDSDVLDDCDELIVIIPCEIRYWIAFTNWSSGICPDAHHPAVFFIHCGIC